MVRRLRTHVGIRTYNRESEENAAYFETLNILNKGAFMFAEIAAPQWMFWDRKRLAQ